MSAIEDRDKKVTQTLGLVLLLNLSISAAKLVLGVMIGSLALVADGIHAALDAASNVVGLVGVHIGSRPPDAGHPYGHRRFETIATAIIGLFVAGGLVGIGDAVVTSVMDRRPPPVPTLEATVVVVLTVIGGLVVSRYELRKGRELRSSILVADAGHTFSDVLGSVVVLASFVGVWLGWRWADVVAATLVSFVIGRTAWGILSRSFHALADGAQLDPASVLDVATGVEGVRSAHKVRSRGAADHVHVDLHIQLDPQVPLVDAHRITHAVSAAITQAFPGVCDVVIHTEPARH